MTPSAPSSQPPRGCVLAVRADEQPPGCSLGAAEHVADTVDDRRQPGLGKFLGKPLARGNVDLGIGRPVDAGLIAAKLGEAFEVAEEPRSVDFRHGWRHLSAN